MIAKLPRFKAILCFAALVITQCSNLYALESAVRFSHLTDRDGLPQNTVFAIHQDSLGFMWFGTADGLARFDGYDFDVFKRQYNQTNSISDNFIRHIEEDKYNNLWIATHRGLNRYNPRLKRFTGYLQNLSIWSVQIDPHNNIWVGTTEGLFVSPLDNVKFKLVDLVGDQTHIRTIAIDDKNSVWLGTTEKGLIKYLPKTQEIAHFPSLWEPEKPNQSVTVNVLKINDNALWIGSEKQGLGKIDLTDNTMSEFSIHHQINQVALENPTYSSSIKENLISAVHFDTEGNLWIGTDKALYKIKRKAQFISRFENNPANPNSIGKDRINAIYTSRDGILWLATWKDGLSQVLPPTGIYNWDRSVLGDNIVSALYQDPQNQLFIGRTKGLVMVSENRDKVTSIGEIFGQSELLNNEYIRSITKLGDDLWVGTKQGLYQLNLVTKRVKQYLNQPNNTNSLSHSTIRVLLPANNKQLWVGTQAGLNLFDLDTQSFKLIRDSEDELFEKSLISSLSYAKNGDLWIGTHQGLYRLSPNYQLTRLQHEPNNPASLSHNVVTNVYESSDGVLWIGTNGGLNKLIKQSSQIAFYHYSTADGLATDAISSIQEDVEGRLWISTFQGISMLNPETDQILNFNVSQNTLPDYAVNTGITDQNGLMYFGGLGGLTWFDPQAVEPFGYQAKIIISDFRVANKSVSIKENSNALLQSAIEYVDTLTLPFDTRDVSFEFTALNFVTPNQILYRYRLKGYHSEWIETSPKRRQFYFTDLSPGRYQLQIAASNSSHIWSENQVKLNIEILPPWWQAWWFIALSILLATSLSIALYRYRFLQLQKRQAKLKKLVFKRTLQLEQKNAELERAYETMKDISMTDQLTGLKNRHFLMSYLNDDIAKVDRAYLDWRQSPENEKPTDVDLIIFSLDLDYFKSVNDRFGHSNGDFILVQLKEIFRSVFRESDYFVRWGGEEFLVIARFTNRIKAPELAERLRQKIENFEFVMENEKTINMTASIGFVSYPFIQNNPTRIHWTEVVGISDKCLYAAKYSGRNAWVGITDVDESADAFPLRSHRINIENLIALQKVSVQSSFNYPINWSAEETKTIT